MTRPKTIKEAWEAEPIYQPGPPPTRRQRRAQHRQQQAEGRRAVAKAKREADPEVAEARAGLSEIRQQLEGETP